MPGEAPGCKPRTERHGHLLTLRWQARGAALAEVRAVAPKRVASRSVKAIALKGRDLKNLRSIGPTSFATITVLRRIFN